MMLVVRGALLLVATASVSAALVILGPRTPAETHTESQPLASPSPLPLPAPERFVLNPEPVYKATGGPFISPAVAIDLALARAQVAAPAGKAATKVVHRQVVGLTTYGAIVAWSGGSRTYRIDLAREVYLVVMSTDYVPQRALGTSTLCHWVGVVIDASDGTARELHCGPTTWPTNLPEGLSTL